MSSFVACSTFLKVNCIKDRMESLVKKLKTTILGLSYGTLFLSLRPIGGCKSDEI